MRTESLPCLARLQLTEEDRMACRKSKLLVQKISFTRFIWEVHVARDLSTLQDRSFCLVLYNCCEFHRDGIFKLLMSPGIDYKESIPPAYVAWWTGPTTLILLGS
jgi:hypothetical protein